MFPFSFWKAAAPPAPACVPVAIGLVSEDYEVQSGLAYYNDVEQLRTPGGTVYGSQYLYFQAACEDAYFTGAIGLARRDSGGAAEPEGTFPHHLTYDAPELMGYTYDEPYFLTDYRVRVYPVTWVTDASETWIVWFPGSAGFPITNPDKFGTFEVYNNLP